MSEIIHDTSNAYGSSTEESTNSEDIHSLSSSYILTNIPSNDINPTLTTPGKDNTTETETHNKFNVTLPIILAVSFFSLLTIIGAIWYYSQRKNQYSQRKKENKMFENTNQINNNQMNNNQMNNNNGGVDNLQQKEESNESNESMYDREKTIESMYDRKETIESMYDENKCITSETKGMKTATAGVQITAHFEGERERIVSLELQRKQRKPSLLNEIEGKENNIIADNGTKDEVIHTAN